MALAAYPIQNYDVLVGGETPHHWHKGLVFWHLLRTKKQALQFMNVVVVGSMRMILMFWGGCVSFCFFFS